MPGLHLFTSNRLEILQQKMTARISASPPPPLQKEIVVVQSTGMQRWLNLEIARQTGICAHMEYLFPRVFAYNLFRQVIELPEKSLYAPEIMTWQILKYLPDLAATGQAPSIANYLKNDNTGLKRYQLAEKIAVLFDRYTLMRPEIVSLWDRGENPLATDFAESRWQAALWQMLPETGAPKDTPPHHAALKKLFMETPAPSLDLPERVNVFGISALPPYYIDIFQKIARQIDVDVYYLNPCREYWEYAYSAKQITRFTKEGLTEDDAYYDCGNSLLASMGSAGREFFSLVLDRVGDTGEDLFENPGEKTLLAGLQSDILNLRQRKKKDGPPVAKTDASIRIHACHSRFREVEVLHDQLLDLFARNQDLQPTDIIIMMPDVTAYAPLVQAVFNTRGQNVPQIPYSIADTHIRGINTLADTFLKILAIDQKRYRAPAVLDILETPAVRKRFGITEQGLARIKKWVAETGIRWGIDSRYRKDLGLPGHHQNTWQFGIERMLLGYALPPDDDAGLFADILPYGDIEGDAAHLLGAFTHFVQTLFNQATALNRSRPVLQWAAHLADLLDIFFVRDETTESDIGQIRDTLTDQGLSGYAAATGFDEPVSMEVIRAYLEKRIGTEALSFGFISSGVTFCTLLPMRSIPFKVVGMLGLNDGDYPRSSQSPGFDLMAKRRQLGDWSKRHEDRYLFLESILSARQNLIMSYIGCDPKDNSVRPPSVLVSELLDYLEAGFETGAQGGLRDQLVIRHPLHPFSPRYFQGDDRLGSYSQPDCRAALDSLAVRQAPPAFPEKSLPAPALEKWADITITRLNRFFNNPAEFLARNRLRVNFRPGEANLPEEREPFDLDALQAYHIRNDLATAGLAAGDTRPFVETLLASGRLPHGSIGQLALAGFTRDAAEFIDRVKNFSSNEPAAAREVSVMCGREMEITVRGTLQDVYPEGQLFYRCANLKAKDLLKAWMYHLLLNASTDPAAGQETTVISWDETVSFRHVAGPDARAELAKLAGYFLAGLQGPLIFFPETSRAFAAAVVENKKPVVQALQAARKKWDPGYYHQGESEDIYLQRYFGMEMPASPEFQKTALDIFQPLLSARLA